MKKILLIIIAALVVGSPAMLFAASCTQGTLVLTRPEVVAEESWITIIKGVWTSDADGEVDGTTGCQITINGYVMQVVTDPSATAPTTLYDIVLLDEFGVDVMGGSLANRSATATEQAVTLIGGVAMPRFVNGIVALEVDNAGAAKIGDFYIYIYREKNR